MADSSGSEASDVGLFGKKRAAGSGVAVGEGAFAGAALFGAADSLASGGALSDVEFRHVYKAYGANEVLRRVTFTLPGGGVRCLMAPATQPASSSRAFARARSSSHFMASDDQGILSPTL